MTIVLGISASLRNARYGLGNETLVSDLAKINTQDELQAYLRSQTQIRFQDFVDAGRAEKSTFDKIYDQLRRLRGERGLSNSEAACAASLWGAQREGATIRHLSLAHHFPMSGGTKDAAELRRALLESNAIILSSPVYFGDRGSLSQSLIEFIAADTEIKSACAGKIYAGLAVGAKRNGGQETTLIYQMLDMVNLNFLAVGNSSETTSQYGGTCVAGDVGTFHDDKEGLETSIGTGQRVSRVARMIASADNSKAKLNDPLKLQLWLLQDDVDKRGHKYFEKWAQDIQDAAGDAVKIQIIDTTKSPVTRCIACDICPTSVGTRDQYRCIIKTHNDFFTKHHEDLIQADAVLLCAYSPVDRSRITSQYQQFIERTRYIRRDNYIFSDIIMAPFVIGELSALQNLHLRMLTSAIRHHTVLHHPLIGMIHEDEILNRDRLVKEGLSFVKQSIRMTLGRYLDDPSEDIIYKPKGYQISALKAIDDNKSADTPNAIRANALAHKESGKRRLVFKD